MRAKVKGKVSEQPIRLLCCFARSRGSSLPPSRCPARDRGRRTLQSSNPRRHGWMDIYRDPSWTSCRPRARSMSSSSMFRFVSGKSGGDGGGGGGGEHGVAVMEVTVLSAESLRLPPSYSPLPRRLRPYVTVSSSAASDSTGVASSSFGAAACEHSWDVDEGTVVVPVGAGFLEGGGGGDYVHVEVYSESSCTRRLIAGGDTPIGWCRVPAADVLDGLRPPRALRRLSYSLRCPRRGSAGHGVVHLAVRVLGLDDDDDTDVVARRRPAPPPPPPVQPGWCRVAMGIPVSGPSAAPAVVGTPWASWGETSR